MPDQNNQHHHTRDDEEHSHPLDPQAGTELAQAEAKAHTLHGDHDHPHPHDHDHDNGHDDDHPHPHDHNHDHPHPHDHDHSHGDGVLGKLAAVFHIGHSHDHSDLAADRAFVDNNLGIRTVWLAMFALGLTSILQVFIVILSGSVALLADTVHNIGDGLNSIPLLIAFYLARRLANRRYTFGFARAEDVAGIFIVLSIAFSAAVVLWESVQRLLNPEPMTGLWWVAAAAVIGFVGNELVALLQIGVGRRIGSAALIADGLHARLDGLTSLSVLIAVIGTAIGIPILDPIIGILIGIAILFIVKDATIRMWYRLMDAIEPEILDQAEAVAKRQPDVREVRRVRMRWMGHRLHAEVHIAVDADLTTAESHHMAELLRRSLFRSIPKLSEVIVHTDPWPELPAEHHQLTNSYEAIPQELQWSK